MPDDESVDAHMFEAGILSTDRAMFSAHSSLTSGPYSWMREDTIATYSPASYGLHLHLFHTQDSQSQSASLNEPRLALHPS
jgi:hypothetical protein